MPEEREPEVTRSAVDSIVAEITRRQFLGRCCATCFALSTGTSVASLAAGCGGDGGGSSTKTTLRVGHLPAGCIQHLLLAQKRGMFENEGLNVQLTAFNGPGENIQSFVAGAHDVMHNPWTNTITAYARGQKDLRIVGGSGKGGIELVAREGSVKSVAEFADAAGTGLRVGTLRLDTLELVTYGTMKKADVGYEDYEMTFFPSMVGMGEALIKETVDVASLAQPYGATVVGEAGGTYISDSNDAWGPEASDCVVTVKSDYLDENGSALETYFGVLREAARERDADYEKALDDLVPLYGVERDVLASGLDRQVPQTVLDDAGLQSLHNGVGYLIELGYLKADLIDEIFDGSVQPESA